MQILLKIGAIFTSAISWSGESYFLPYSRMQAWYHLKLREHFLLAMKIPDSFLNCGYFLDKNFKAITKFQWLICNYWYLESESAEWYPFIVHVFIVIIVISVNCLWWFCCWFHSKLICCVWHRWCDEKMCAVLDTCNCLSFLQQLSAMLNLIHVTINLTLKYRQGPFAIGDNNKVFWCCKHVVRDGLHCH